MLIESACAGDVLAYERLVERYQDVAFRTAFVVTREAGAAEDAAQEAFIRAFRALPSFRRGSPFRPWLLRIVGNEARRRQAASVRQRNISEAVSRALTRRSVPSVEADVLEADLRRRLHKTIEALSETDRLVIVCRFVLDLSETEMAAAMNCRPGTVKSRLSRALARLKARLVVQEPDLVALRAADG